MTLGSRVSDAEVLKIAYSELFDHAYYSRVTAREFGSVRDAARHFCERGWRDGLNPSRLFDTKRYIRLYDDVRSSGRNPLEHYLTEGRAADRTPRLGSGLLSDRPRAPSEDRWAALSSERGAGAPAHVGVDVVVPVYRGYDDTLACLYSALTARVDRDFQLIVVNDSSPEPELTIHLRALAERGLFQLIEHEHNLGFVATANEGMALHPDRDVVLLNADTVVYDGWLDRLSWHAQQPGVGTVTPMSNNATVCSYPFTLENNNCDLELDHAELDAVFADVNARRSVETPTGVGFCFYIRRALLDRIGPLDVETFGIGYGEENDFCMRAAKAGWRNLIALDTYVRHTGEVSFSAAAAAQKSRGMQALTELHPEYMELVESFIASDPVRPAREAVDLARLQRANAGRGVLFVDHGWTGGILRHLHELTAQLSKAGVTASRLTPSADGARLLLSTLSPLDMPNLPRIPAADARSLIEVLTSLRLSFVHVHSLVAHRLETFETLTESIAEAGLTYRLTIHDYTPICPRITMVDWGGSYCHSPAPEHCRTCISKAGTEFGAVDIDHWREAYGHVVRSAERIIVPDEDVERRLREYIDIPQPILVRPHQLWRRAAAQPPRRRPAPGRERSIGVIGAIGPHKGSGVLLAMAGDITARRLPLRIKLYGYADRLELEQFECCTVTGRYREEDLAELVADDPCDMVFLPAVWPETYSYTLDKTLSLGLHPVCFDIGAPAARLERLGLGDRLPTSLIYDVEALNDTLLMLSPEAYRLEALGPDAWWGSQARYYAEDEAIASPVLRAAE